MIIYIHIETERERAYVTHISLVAGATYSIPFITVQGHNCEKRKRPLII